MGCGNDGFNSFGRPNNRMGHVRCRMWSSVAITTSTGASTLLTFNRALENPSGMWTPATPTRIYAIKSGLYHVWASVQLLTGHVRGYLSISRNSVLSFTSTNINDLGASFANGATASGTIFLKSGEYVDAGVYTATGIASGIRSDLDYTPTLAMSLIG